jgi:peptidoglycan hydrolase-like protein with peptidoglycan-binding domain
MTTQESYSPDLRDGDTGEWVTYLQQMLAAAGYDPGPADGEFGALTATAVRQLQANGGAAQTGIADQTTWGLLNGAGQQEHHDSYVPDASGGQHDQPAGGSTGGAPKATAEAFVQLCLAQEGDDYDYGVDVDLTDPDPASFDCAELVEWALAQVGALDGLKGDWNWSQGQRAAIEAAGLGCSVDEARHIRGALLFNSHHVAVSLGDGQTIEAMGEDFNVRKGKVDGTSGSPRFDGAGRVPNLQY